MLCAFALSLGLLAAFSLPARAVNGSFGPGSGDGSSAAQAKIIEDAADLNAVRNGLGLYYKLAGDIDLTDYLLSYDGPGYNGGAYWNPIGTAATPFTGNFDGAGHTINGLMIYRDSASYAGLFGYASGAVIANLGVGISVFGGGITGGGTVGALVGRLDAGAITNSHVVLTISSDTPPGYDTCSITGGDEVGALVGRLDAGGAITNSYATCSVSGSSRIGGLVGYQSGGIANSYASSGSYGVMGDSEVGGLVGRLDAGSITNSHATGGVYGSSSAIGGLAGYQHGDITNSYAGGSPVNGDSEVGGLVGHQDAGSITNSHATGDVYGSSSAIGGLAGYQNGSIASSYATGSVSGDSEVGGLAGHQDSGGNITNSYAGGGSASGSWGYLGGASGTTQVGGLVGYQGGGITNSYAGGAVSGDSDVGGLVGHQGGGAITASFFDTDSTAQAPADGVGNVPGVAGVTGKTTDQMQEQATFTTDTGNSAGAPASWDFPGTWCMLPGSYPKLAWQASCAPGGNVIDLSDPDPPSAGAGWTLDQTTGYTILDGANVIITGDGSVGGYTGCGYGCSIAVEPGAKATLTLNNMVIPGGGSSQSPLWLQTGAQVTLMLAGGSVNSITGGYSTTAIQVDDDVTLTIDSNGPNAVLNATGNNEGSGSTGIGSSISSIGDGNHGGAIVINGGTINAIGGRSYPAIGGGNYNYNNDNDNGVTITINGGTVNAIVIGGGGGGGGASGIGGGTYSSGPITITGGTVNATGNGYSAGIGSAGMTGDAGDITITGGTVNATGGSQGAGIGGAYYYGYGGNITITGGTVSATGGDQGGAGIGSGIYGDGDTTTIAISGNAHVTATGGAGDYGGGAAGIGGGAETTGGTITISGNASVKAIGSAGNDNGGGAGIGSGGTADTSPLAAGTISIVTTGTINATGGAGGVFDSLNYTSGSSVGEGGYQGNLAPASIPLYTITASADTGGSIAPSGTVTVSSGADAAFTITPDSGYSIDQVQVDGANNPAAVASGSHTFTNVTASHTIAASFTSGTPPAATITITTQPQNVTVTEGAITGSLTIGATVNPSGTLTYQWYSNTTASNTGGALLAGEQGASFTIPTTLTAGTYYYYCVVNAAGATPLASDVATVTVNPPAATDAQAPTITAQPQGAAYTQGATA
ncbi:MAG: hypothetical protein LBI48_06975, partial [Burkholderiaceae bacterium]|nr:hypothetical protein [Burkholderiaceae bacterium]